jgi:phosphoribosylamine--glycine ligase
MVNQEQKKKSIKFLFISNEALIGDLVWEIKKSGHEVKYFIQSKTEKDICDGFVDKADDWEKFKDWADVIVFDDVGFGELAAKLRKEGKLVIGGSPYTDKLELDRNFGQEEMKNVGINILPNWSFSDFDEAMKFIQKNPERYVVKPNGIAQNEKELSFIGQDDDGRDLVDILNHYKNSWGKKIKHFQLQKFAPGVEVAVGVFFNGKEFIMPINVNFEHKKMFPGDIGPTTGEMGTSMFWSESNKIFNETLLKMKDKLVESGYIGYIDINCIVNWRGIYPLEFTTRFGYPTISIQMEGVLSDWGEFLYALAKGENYELKTKKGFQIGVVIAIPPFPFTDPNAFKKYSEDAVIMFRKPDLSGVHIGEVKIVDNDWRVAGESGYVLIITGSGTTMEEARKQAYLRVENIMIPNLFYRDDIGEEWASKRDKLHTWGYIY